MNIGIDIDGTLNKYPEFFEMLIRNSEGRDKFFIITGLGREKAIERLKKVTDKYPDITYSELIDTSMYNEEERALIGKVESNEEVVGRFKQRMCKELGVEIMFDDMASIHRQFGDIPIFEVK